MRALVDLVNNRIISWGIIYDAPEFDDIAFNVPDDYSEERYSYIPITPGIFDPNGFVLRPQINSINIEKRQNNINAVNSYMASFIGNGITQANFDLFQADTAALQQQYLGAGGRFITWVESVNRNGYDARTVGFKTRTNYRGPSTNGVEGVNGNYPRANRILEILNDL